MRFSAEFLPPNQPSLIFAGTTQAPAPAFGDGLRCAGGSLLRILPPINSGPSGMLEFGPGLVQSSCGTGGCITPASTWNFQVYYRDPAGPCGNGFNTTNGASVLFAP